MQLRLKNLALPVWAGLFCMLAAIILPWQAGVYLRGHLASTLERLAGNLQAEAQVRDYQQGIWQSSATVLIQSALLREPVELVLLMRHGPWLGFNPAAHATWGWFSLQTRLPTQGGLTIFPAESAVDAWLYADLFGLLHLGGQLHDKTPDLGEIRLRSLMQGNSSQCRGELRLPGFKWRAPAGDFIAADVVLRVNMQREHGERRGDFSADALRAAWVAPSSPTNNAQMPTLPPSLLLEQPRIEVVRATSTQVTAAWASARGINLSRLGLGNSIELGRLNTRLSWHDVDWNVLWSSTDALNLMRLNIPALNALTYALGEGQFKLETLELQHTQGRFVLSGELATHTPVQDWRDLELHLQSEISQSMLIEWMLDTRLVSSPQTALEQLEALRAQGWLETPTSGQLSASLNLWRGEMSLSSRHVPLNVWLQ
jgi:hypothetical protein